MRILALKIFCILYLKLLSLVAKLGKMHILGYVDNQKYENKNFMLLTKGKKTSSKLLESLEESLFIGNLDSYASLLRI